MNCTVYEKPDYDLICFPGYMYLGTKTPGLVDAPRFPVRLGSTDIESVRTRITTIGKRRPGASSAGFKVLDMLPGSWLTLAGTFTANNGVLVLFDSWKNGRFQFAAKGPGGTVPGTDYVGIYVAFYSADNDRFFYTTNNQAGRIVTKDFQFMEAGPEPLPAAE